MTRYFACVSVSVASALIATAAVAQPLTTTFAGGGEAAGLMFDLTASVEEVVPDYMQLAGSLPAGSTITVWSRQGSYVGHESDPSGWSVTRVTPAVSGDLATVSLGMSELGVNMPTGVFVVVSSTPSVAGLNFTPIPPAAASYSNTLIRLAGGVAKGPGGFAGTTMANAMVNGLLSVRACYANCNASTVVPFLNVMDFVCFNNQFAAGATSANCDRSTVQPVLSVNDFICFMNKFAAGCSAP